MLLPGLPTHVGRGQCATIAVKRDTVTKSGPLKTYQLKSDSGKTVELGFCGDCGSPIYKTTTKVPELIFFFAGSLDDPSSFMSKAKVYEERRQPWDLS